MDYKRQNTVLSVMFILVGMMFLVPATTEKALAIITATARTTICCFSHVTWGLSAGRWIFEPKLASPTEIYWKTAGRIFPPSAETGYVRASVGPAHSPVVFSFHSPSVGLNGCAISPPFFGTCTVLPPVAPLPAIFGYFVTHIPTLNGGDINSDEGDNSDNDGDNSGDTP